MVKIMEMSPGTENSDLDVIREHVLASLGSDIQSEIERLRSNAPESAVTAFVDRTLILRRPEKILALNDLLVNRLGEEGIGSLNAIREPDEQSRVVNLIETSLNKYLEEDKKEAACKELGRLLN